MSLQMSPDFQHILRVLNTNIDGKRKVMFAMTKITGIGKRFSNLICKKAEIDVDRRAGSLTNEEVERLVAIISNPTHFKVPGWFVNRQKDRTTGKTTQLVVNGLIGVCREDITRLKKIRAHRGIRHYWNCRVRGQHTKTTGRKGRVCGMPGGANAAKYTPVAVDHPSAEYVELNRPPSGFKKEKESERNRAVSSPHSVAEIVYEQRRKSFPVFSRKEVFQDACAAVVKKTESSSYTVYHIKSDSSPQLMIKEVSGWRSNSTYLFKDAWTMFYYVGLVFITYFVVIWSVISVVKLSH